MNPTEIIPLIKKVLYIANSKITVTQIDYLFDIDFCKVLLILSISMQLKQNSRAIL